MKKFISVVLVLIVIVIGASAYMLNLATSTEIGEEIIIKSSMNEEEVNDFIRELQNDKGTVELSSKECNSITNRLSEEINLSEGIKVESINSKIQDGMVHIQVPTEIKGKDVLLSAKGSIETKGDKLVIEVENLKSGKLELPKDLIGDKLNEILNDENIQIQGNTIEINFEKLPFDLKDIEIKGDKLLVNKK